jgi:hypothetical protein
MLLVDDGQPEARECHAFFEDGMRSHQQVEVPLGKFPEHPGALGPGDSARQHAHANAHRSQQVCQYRACLLSKNLGRAQDSALVSGCLRGIHSKSCHRCLAGANVPVQQAVHLPVPLDIAFDVSHCCYLGTSRLERQAAHVAFKRSRRQGKPWGRAGLF